MSSYISQASVSVSQRTDGRARRDAAEMETPTPSLPYKRKFGPVRLQTVRATACVSSPEVSIVLRTLGAPVLG
ncbi:hypothetical protein MRX96_055283 [Rhipicephalus microplus]